MIDCMVNYFSDDGDPDGGPRRYYCYHVVAGPGPTGEAGVATITTLAVHEGDRPCNYCTNWFFAPRGGPEAALARALFYLDAYHNGRRLRRVTGQIRRAPGQEQPGPSLDEPGLSEGIRVACQRGQSPTSV